jgi:hypothetical protein
MITSLFSQKNICAAIGLVMAITIVWKAKEEINLSQRTALIEYSEPTHNTGITSNSEAEKAYDFKKIRIEVSIL